MSLARPLLSALGVGFTFTLGNGGDKLAFQPKDGSALSKTFETSSDFALDELSLIVGGQDVAQMIGAVEMNMTNTSKIEVTDVYKKVVEGRPLELLRTYDGLSASTQMEVSPGEMEIPEVVSVSELEGKTVVFRWNEEEQVYERSFQDGEGDEKLLEALEEDMDLRCFLPASEVAKDGTWTVELLRLESVAMPGGNLRLLPEEGVDDEQMEMFEELFGDFGKQIAEQLEGECACTYKGTVEESGQTLAEIAIEVEVATTLDLTDVLQGLISKAIAEQAGEVEVEFSLETADFSVDYTGSGTLLWNLAAGRAHSFQLGGDLTLGVDLVVHIEAQGESQGMDASAEFSGSVRYELAAKE